MLTYRKDAFLLCLQSKSISYQEPADQPKVIFMAVATLSSRFQISIPKEIRDRHNWRAGQKFAFIPQRKGVVLVPVPTRDELCGIAKGADTSNYRDRNDRY